MKEITSIQNETVKKLKRLMAKSSERNRTGTYPAEGRRSVNDTPPELLEQVYMTRAFWKDYAKQDAEIRRKWPEPVILSEDCMKSISGTREPQGVIAVVRMKKISVSDLLKGAGFILLLDRVSDPGNFGTLLRTAEAAGVDGILCSPGCVDRYNPKVVRSAMSSLSRLRIVTYESEEIVLKEVQRAGFTLAVSDLKDSTDYRNLPQMEKAVLVVGNEANGVCQALRDAADLRIRIPMSGRIESLNVAVAGAILLYELRNCLNIR